MYSTSLITGKCKSKPQRDITSQLLDWLSSKSQEITSAVENEEKSLCTACRDVNWYSYYKKSMKFPQKIKNITTV